MIYLPSPFLFMFSFFNFFSFRMPQFFENRDLLVELTVEHIRSEREERGACLTAL